MPSTSSRVLEAEKHAETIEEWCPTVIPGLLQTEAYTRAVVQATHPLAPDEEVEEKVNARMARARLFEDDHKTPEYWVILHESLLRHPILPPEADGRPARPHRSAGDGATGSFHRSFRGTADRIPSWWWAWPRS